MKLIKLHLYGFGRFQNVQIELANESIHVFLGENEAGKSTIRAFIRCILFGFPTKQQSELRYEPRLGGQYGGSIVIDTNQYGKVTVERISGKATGDVHVYFADGSIGGEAELKLVLNEVDYTIFSGIYSFGLADLQMMEQLQSDELNKFIYGVGISGRHNLLEIEKKNDKTIQVLYKPTGRKPLINQQLRKVVEADEQVNSWKKQLNNYERLMEERIELQKLLEKTSEEQHELNRSYRYFEKLQAITPLVINKKTFENRLQQLPPYIPFPEEGIERLEKLLDHSLLIVSDMKAIEKKLQKINDDKKLLNVNESLDKLEEMIERIKESRQIYETKQKEKELILQQIQYEQQEYTVMVEKLGYKDAFFATSFVAEQNLLKLVEKEATLKQKDLLLQSQLDQAKAALEEKETQVESLKKELLADHVRKELEQKLAKKQSEIELQKEIEFINDGLQLVTNQLNYFEKTEKTKKTMILVSIFASFCGAIIFFLDSQYLLGSLFVFALLLMILFSKNKHTYKTELQQQRETFLVQKEVLIKQLENIPYDDFERVQQMLKKDQQTSNQLFFKEQNLAEANEAYQLICKELDKCELDIAVFHAELANWADEFRYPLQLEATQYMKLLNMMEETKQKQRHLNYLREKLAIIETDLQEMIESVENVCKILTITFHSENYLQNVERLVIILKEAQEIEKTFQRLTDQQTELNEELKRLNVKYQQYQQEIEKLYQLANVATEEEFRVKGKAWFESQQIVAQLRIINSQLSPFIGFETELIELEEDVLLYKDLLTEKMLEVEMKSSHARDQEKKWHKQLAEINQEIKNLEQGSSYSLVLHHLETERGTLISEARKWAFHRTVQLIIDEAKKVYEKERQPQVVKEATKMFQLLTNGQYVQLYAPIGEQRFFVERNDGLTFQPNELSQGTQEQLYLAIRFALATVHSKHTSFPIFIDDIFVNFDQRRRQKAVEIMKEMAKKHQIIFFTCHPFIAKEVSNGYFLLEDRSSTN